MKLVINKFFLWRSSTSFWSNSNELNLYHCCAVLPFLHSWRLRYDGLVSQTSVYIIVALGVNDKQTMATSISIRTSLLPWWPSIILCCLLHVICRPEPDTEPLISVVEFYQFATHIAVALEFLASQQYVHRDVAARNCLGKCKPAVKVIINRLVHCSLGNCFNLFAYSVCVLEQLVLVCMFMCSSVLMGYCYMYIHTALLCLLVQCKQFFINMCKFLSFCHQFINYLQWEMSW